MTWARPAFTRGTQIFTGAAQIWFVVNIPANLKELLAHMYRDVERLIVGLRQDPPGEPDADAVTYWTAYDPVADAVDIADRAKLRAASYGTSSPATVTATWPST